MDDFEELWIKNPMYLIRSLKDFLPLFQNQPMKLSVGERFHYNNAGYILLGLIIEQTSQIKFADYIKEHIFKRSGMAESGYYEFDSLPIRTAKITARANIHRGTFTGIIKGIIIPETR